MADMGAALQFVLTLMSFAIPVGFAIVFAAVLLAVGSVAAAIVVMCVGLVLGVALAAIVHRADVV